MLLAQYLKVSEKSDRRPGMKKENTSANDCRCSRSAPCVSLRRWASVFGGLLSGVCVSRADHEMRVELHVQSGTCGGTATNSPLNCREHILSLNTSDTECGDSKEQTPVHRTSAIAAACVVHPGRRTLWSWFVVIAFSLRTVLRIGTTHSAFNSIRRKKNTKITSHLVLQAAEEQTHQLCRGNLLETCFHRMLNRTLLLPSLFCLQLDQRRKKTSAWRQNCWKEPSTLPVFRAWHARSERGWVVGRWFSSHHLCSFSFLFRLFC